MFSITIFLSYTTAPSSNDSLVTSVDTSCAASILEDADDTNIISFADVDDMYEEVIMNCHPQRALELRFIMYFYHVTNFMSHFY